MPSKENFQKELRSDIAQKLDSVLSDLKSMLGEKEFTDRVKKAAKLFADGVKAKPAQKEAGAEKKKAVKNDTSTSSEQVDEPVTETADVKVASKKASVKAKGKKK